METTYVLLVLILSLYTQSNDLYMRARSKQPTYEYAVSWQSHNFDREQIRKWIVCKVSTFHVCNGESVEGTQSSEPQCVVFLSQLLISDKNLRGKISFREALHPYMLIWYVELREKPSKISSGNQVLACLTPQTQFTCTCSSLSTPSLGCSLYSTYFEVRVTKKRTLSSF